MRKHYDFSKAKRAKDIPHLARLQAAGRERSIGREILQGIREIKRGHAGRVTKMLLTRNYKETTMADMRRDRAFRVAYLGQAIECLHGGEFAAGKRMLRDYINGTLGFAALSKATATPAKGLMRMLSENSNPHADKLFAVLSHLQEVEGVKVKVLLASRARSRRKSERIGA